MAVYYLETGCLDSHYNLAFEEYVLTHCTAGDYLILWQYRNAVIVGRNQNAEAEINRSYVEAHNIDVVRRNTGGGTVYHDMGNLNYSFITDAGPAEERSCARFSEPVVAALQQLGLNATLSGRNDILVDGKKVSGTAQQLLKGRILHHGTLLFDTDPEKIAGALRPDPSKYQSKGIQSVRSRVGSIRAALKQDMDMQAFHRFLKAQLFSGDVIPLSLTEEQLAEVRRLKSEKYDTWQWNFGRSPKFSTCLRQRYPGGLLELHLTVEQGCIREVAILGDFLGLADLQPLEQALLSCPYREDAIREVLARFPLEDMLGSITADEFVVTIFNK